MSQGLTSGSGLIRHSLGVHQIRVLLRGLLALNSGLLGCGAVGKVLVSSVGIWKSGELELWFTEKREATVKGDVSILET